MMNWEIVSKLFKLLIVKTSDLLASLVILNWFIKIVFKIVFDFVFSLIQNNPEVAMDSIVHITQHMTSGQRAEVARILATMESAPNSP